MEAQAPTPFLQMIASDHPVPPGTYKEIFRFVSLMVENTPPEDDVPASFEESRITVGFTPAEAAENQAYYNEETWPNVQGGTPVAVWDSGLSQGCTMTLFIMPDGTFEWTEP